MFRIPWYKNSHTLTNSISNPFNLNDPFAGKDVIEFGLGVFVCG